ncbi:hypothetical protein BDK51DRAFT_39859 [Blyttiomyces helicus]|uniref:Uncharacterized protein n=1 Tax=Blyttiomyces helicus TaxID=388810 RepID=A0A4P9WAJ6_9FUNG|nr:hypothetical protein BDK51DRAFT_39859 [Blyttiomyces helicus]|eukprot:RKO88585.1 hypothetical protein BDK51DRAFT_39859 [Blyttiomyces helicus]
MESFRTEHPEEDEFNVREQPEPPVFSFGIDRDSEDPEDRGFASDSEDPEELHQDQIETWLRIPSALVDEEQALELGEFMSEKERADYLGIWPTVMNPSRQRSTFCVRWGGGERSGLILALYYVKFDFDICLPQSHTTVAIYLFRHDRNVSRTEAEQLYRLIEALRIKLPPISSIGPMMASIAESIGPQPRDFTTVLEDLTPHIRLEGTIQLKLANPYVSKQVRVMPENPRNGIVELCHRRKWHEELRAPMVRVQQDGGYADLWVDEFEYLE